MGKRASIETVLNRELQALNDMTLSKDPQTVLKAGKELRLLQENFKLAGNETSLRPAVKLALQKYCMDVIKLPKDEREE